MSMYLFLETPNEEYDLRWFDDLDKAKAQMFLGSEFYEEGELEVAEDGMRGFLNTKYVDCEWNIVKVPVADHLHNIFEEFRDTSGWRGLSPEAAIECFIRYVRNRR